MNNSPTQCGFDPRCVGEIDMALRVVAYGRESSWNLLNMDHMKCSRLSKKARVPRIYSSLQREKDAGHGPASDVDTIFQQYHSVRTTFFTLILSVAPSHSMLISVGS